MIQNHFHKRYMDGEDSLQASSRYISEIRKTRRTTFTIRVPLAIARLVDSLVEGDDTLDARNV